MKPYREARADFLREYVMQALVEARGNHSQAARAASINRVHFLKLMKRAGFSLGPAPKRGNWRLPPARRLQA